MSKITPLLYIGNETDASNKNILKSKNIKLIVNTASEIPNYFPKEFEYLRLDLDDNPTQNLNHVLDSSSQKIIQSLKNGRAVFVHSKAGKSRSSSIIIYVLMKLHDWNYDRAFRYLKNIYSIIDPNYGFIEQLVGKNTEHNRQTITHIETPIENIEFISETLDEEPPEEELSHPMSTNRFPLSKYKKIDGESDQKEDPENRWTKLTLDCPECEQPGYTPLRHGRYARIFT